MEQRNTKPSQLIYHIYQAVSNLFLNSEIHPKWEEWTDANAREAVCLCAEGPMAYVSSPLIRRKHVSPTLCLCETDQRQLIQS